jgi:hypothetical protein
MNIETLIDLLLVAKSKGITQVDIVDQEWNDYTIESIDLNKGDFGEKVVIQIGIDDFCTIGN